MVSLRRLSNSHFVVFDVYVIFGKFNRRVEWFGYFIVDFKFIIVIFFGDCADMHSFCSYDKGKKSFQGRTYKADIDVHHDFQDRVWNTVRKTKRKLPRAVCLIGNHEQRIERAIENQPELEGVIGFGDLELGNWYDTVVYYNGATPGSIELDGISYSHYMVSGIAGRPISGEHSAYSLLSKKYSSCVVGHSHLLDYSVRTRQDGAKIMGLVAGCFQEHESSYAGEANKLWWRGVCHLKNVEKGTYDLETISLARMRKEYA